MFVYKLACQHLLIQACGIMIELTKSSLDYIGVQAGDMEIELKPYL
jgi:hypothetical protein